MRLPNCKSSVWAIKRLGIIIGGATVEEIDELPGMVFKDPIIAKVTSPILIESPGLISNCNIRVASTKAPPNF